MMGIVLDRPFPVFPNGFPRELLDAFEQRIGRGTLGNYAASGTQIIEDLGAEHMRTGKPIVYTSADSVFQIAAHEDVIPIEEQYRINAVAFDLAVSKYGLGRVIARPFVGRARELSNERPTGKTSRCPRRRKQCSIASWRRMFRRLRSARSRTCSPGEASRALCIPASDEEGMDAITSEMASTARGLIFANLVDFDTRVRPPQRCSGLRGESGAVRRQAEGSPASPARR